MARSLFLVVLLMASSQLIHSDTRRLVLEPVERMIQRVREMTDNPLAGVMQVGGAGGCALGAGISRCGRVGVVGGRVLLELLLDARVAGVLAEPAC
jgi:hypothetical protein